MSSANKGGRKAVRAAIEDAQPATPPVTTPPPSGAPSYLAARFAMREDGLFKKSEDGSQASWVCGPVEILAEVRASDQRSWGLQIRWRDRDGQQHSEILLRSMFAGEAAEVRARLADGGLALNSAQWARQALADFLNSAASPVRVRTVTRTGWHVIGPRTVFVLPEQSFGDVGEQTVLQTDSGSPNLFQSQGTLAEWRESVSRLCSGNSRLMFAASCAFAAPLLGLLGEDGGGFHLRGNSRTGKSTALRVSASVCGGTSADGGAGFVRSWRATANGLEAVGAEHCDSLLALDEMGQSDAAGIGESAYLLANGVTKARAGRAGQARATIRFRVLFLSTGELALSDMMAEAGRTTRAGQEVRLVDISADAGAGLGLFEDLHDEPSPGAFAETLRDATRANFGTALPAYLKFLIGHMERQPGVWVEELRRRVNDTLVRWLASVPDAGGQVRSVAGRFALVAVAGELSREAVITEWAEGVPTRATEMCFRAWLADRGTPGAREDAQAVKQLRAFLLMHGDSRFQRWRDRDGQEPQAQAEAEGAAPHEERFRTQKSCGWRRWERLETGLSGWRFYFTGAGMEEALAGLAKKASRTVLAERGFILKPENPADAARGNLAAALTVPGHGKIRLIKISSSLLAGDEGEI